MLGFPTANMFLQRSTIEHLVPYDNGVFFGWGVVEPIKEGSVALPVVLSVGHNPHFADKAVTVEVHFVHAFADDFYGATMRIVVAGRLRDMKKYSGLEALIEDIKADVRRGTETLNSVAEVKELRTHDLLFTPMAATDVPYFVTLGSGGSGRSSL